MPIKPSDAGLRTLYPSLTADGRVSRADVEKLITSAKDGKGLAKTERSDLLAMHAKDVSLFDADAKVHLEQFLGLTQPPGPPVPVTPPPATPQTSTGVWFPTGVVTPPLTPSARAQLEAEVARLAPEVKAVVAPVVAREGRASPALLLAVHASFKGQMTAGSEISKSVWALARQVPLGRELLTEMQGPLPRTYNKQGDLWLYTEKNLDLDMAQALVEARISNWPSWQHDSRHSQLTEVSMALEDSFTYEARQRLVLGGLFDASQIAALTIGLEKDGLDASDVAIIAQRLSTLEPGVQSSEKRTLTKALSYGLKVKPDGEAALSALLGVRAPNLAAPPPPGPLYAPGTVPSRHALGHVSYGDTPLTVLEGRQSTPSAAIVLVRRLGELVTPRVTDGVLKVSTLLQAERSPLWDTLSPGEKLLFPELFSALERTSTVRELTLAPVRTSPLESMVRARVNRPLPIDFKQSVPMTDTLAPPGEDRAVAQRVQRLANSDRNADTLSLADLDAVLAGAPGFTAEDLIRVKATRDRLDTQLRLKNNFASAELELIDLRKENRQVLSEALGLVITRRMDFDANMTLTRETSVTIRLPAGATVRNATGDVVLNAPGNYYQNSPTKLDLPPGRYVVETPDRDAQAFELPAFPPAKESLDLSQYSAYEMGPYAQPTRRPIEHIEEYVRFVKDQFGRELQLPFDYFAPNPLKTFLPAGEYAIPGTDVRVLLNSRVGSQEYLSKTFGGKLTQALVVDGQGNVQSLTGRSGVKLADGRSVSISSTNGKVTFQLERQQHTLDLNHRVG